MMERQLPTWLVLTATLFSSAGALGQTDDTDQPARVAPRENLTQPRDDSKSEAPSREHEVREDAKQRVLLPGDSLEGWTIAREHIFDRRGKVHVQQGSVVLEAGNPATGIRWNGPLPRTNYELRLEAKRIEGSDFFCGLTFPVGAEYCTFIVGGWGGGVTGLSNIDDLAAVENETTDYIGFRDDLWYAIRLRVTDERITGWIDDQQMFDVPRAEKKFSIWWEQEPLRPLGIATWHTTAAVRKIELQELSP